MCRYDYNHRKVIMNATFHGFNYLTEESSGSVITRQCFFFFFMTLVRLAYFHTEGEFPCISICNGSRIGRRTVMDRFWNWIDIYVSCTEQIYMKRKYDLV